MSHFLFQNSQNRKGSKTISLIERNPCLKNIHCILHSSVSSCIVTDVEKNRAEQSSNFLHHIQYWTDLSQEKEFQLMCIFFDK